MYVSLPPDARSVAALSLPSDVHSRRQPANSRAMVWSASTRASLPAMYGLTWMRRYAGSGWNVCLTASHASWAWYRRSTSLEG